MSYRIVAQDINIFSKISPFNFVYCVSFCQNAPIEIRFDETTLTISSPTCTVKVRLVKYNLSTLDLYINAG